MLLCSSYLTGPAMAGAERGRPARQTEAGQPEASLMQVDLNRQELDDTVLLYREAQGKVLLAGEDLARWRVRLPGRPAFQANGQDYYQLQAIPGARFTVDEVKLLLTITLPAAAFEHQQLAREGGAAAVPASASTGALLNYDLLAERDGRQGRLSGLFEVGLFSPYGAGGSTFLGADEGGRRRSTRLETGWTLDQPGQLSSWHLGDAITRAASVWGRAVRFGGVQYGTNFVVQPGLVTMPQQAVSGQAALPSTVDVFVNNALLQHSEVPPGPFSLNNIPVVTGKGDVRVVVRDLLGREQVITQPFFASARLLRPGLSDFSYEAGREREQFGIGSNHYGRWLGAATLRQGLSDSVTGEAHAEWMSGGQATLGATGVFAPSAMDATFNASLAASTSGDGDGYLGSAGVELQRGPFHLGGRTQATSRQFVQIGQQAGQLPARRLSDLSAGFGAGNIGSFSAAYVRQDNRDSARTELLSLSYATNITGRAFIGVNLLKPLAGNNGIALGAFLVVPLDGRTSANASAQRASGPGSPALGSLQVQRGLELGDGVGYRLLASRHGPQQAELLAQNGVGTYSLGAATQSGQTSVRAGVSGGAVTLGGGLFASRRISDSFALVQVPGYPDVRVYADNQLVARTDKQGNALLPRIRAYEANPVSIESNDLPLDAKVDALQLDAVPFYRSGVVLRFPVSIARGATLKIRFADGTPVPVGALVSVGRQAEQFPVVDDGEAYVTGLSASNTLSVDWQGHTCQFSVKFPASNDPLPFLGTYRCEGNAK
ncbi:MAG: fimbria/pilus outer membrane usher protein [Pseudomonadota bacterium]